MTRRTLRASKLVNPCARNHGQPNNAKRKRLQTDVLEVKKDMSIVNERVGSIDMRLSVVEVHISGLMASSRYVDIEIDRPGDRVEILKDKPDD